MALTFLSSHEPSAFSLFVINALVYSVTLTRTSLASSKIIEILVEFFESSFALWLRIKATGAFSNLYQKDSAQAS